MVITGCFTYTPGVMQVLCQVDAADGSPSFDLKEVASQNEAQMANILQTVSAHLNSLDKQFHAQKDDAAFGEVLQVIIILLCLILVN